MRKILVAFLVLGTCGIANLSPTSQNSTPSFQTVSSSTEKNGHDAHSTITEKKREKEITTTPSSTTILPENSKSIILDNPGKGMGATETMANKNETSTSQSHRKELTVTPSSNNAESTTTFLGHKGEGKETKTTSSSYKGELNNPSVTVQTTIKPVNGDKERKSNNNQKPTKTSTKYLDKGKVIIFNGICGPDGCEIEGDIYDELVPLHHAK